MTATLAPVLEWADLTPSQEATLLTSTAVVVDLEASELAADLSFIRDLTPWLGLTDSDDVAWTGSDLVHRQCQFTLATDLAWGATLVQLTQVLTDRLTGLSARRPVGVFVPSTPDTVLGALVLLDDLLQAVTNTVQGQDRCCRLTRLVGYSYVVLAGSDVLGSVAQTFVDAGLSGVRIDTSASGSPVPTDMVWPLVADADASTVPFALPADVDPSTVSSGDIRWIDVINNLLALIGYRGVYADETGVFCCVPLVDAAGVSPRRLLDADATTSVVGVSVTLTRDVYAQPNQWIGEWQNMASGVTPTPGNGGILVVNNVSTGLASQTALGLVVPSTVPITAASAADFAAQLQTQVTTDMRTVCTLTVTTPPDPAAAHFDVLTYADQRLLNLSGVQASSVKVQATGWTLHLSGAATEWTLQVIQ